LRLETRVALNKLQLRSYQKPVFDALFNKDYKRLLCIWPRRAGKDIVGWNVIIRAALQKVGVYFYCAPTYSQGRKIIWDSITNEAVKFLDFLPKELIERKNDQQMKIHLKNGSLIQIIGSDSYDNSIVGSNPQGIIFTEWALSDERAWQFARPILMANDGWAMFNSTPRGKNHLWAMYQIALHSGSWFSQKLTVEDTGHINEETIQRERASGEMSEDLIQQEYYTSFDMGVEGSFYAKYLDDMRRKGQISMVPFEQGFPVHTAWDIGVRDSTCIIFFQFVGQVVRIIDCYDNTKEGLEHYVQHMDQLKHDNGWTWGKHFAPHDIAVTEWGSGLSRAEKALSMGLKFETTRDRYNKLKSVVPAVSVMDGIETVRSSFSKIWIDEQRCAPLIKALENYRQEYDQKRKVYKHIPLHDWASHYADCMRYMCLSLQKLSTRDSSAEELERRYREAVYGYSGNDFFNDPNTRQW
jgi:hypothetical protein